MDREWLAGRLEDGASYEAIAREVGCSASKVSYWAQRYALRSQRAVTRAGRAALDESRLRALVEAGATVREMAGTLERSAATVRYWMRRYGLKTQRRRLSPSDVRRLDALGVQPTLTCPIHGPTRHVRRESGFRCSVCRIADVSARRRRVKRILLDEAGGACRLCGYDACVAALHFHHLDPATKHFTLSLVGVTRALDAARAEARKCVVLCANCHAEVESGVADLPVRSNEAAPRAGSSVCRPG